MGLPRSFYQRDTILVAQELLGKKLIHQTPEGLTAGYIVETEAYLGRKDAAAHSYKGKSPRTEVMFGEKGVAYVYMIYGMYYCLNVVTGPPDEPEAILIRAAEPTDGIALMAHRRNTEVPKNLCSGPGKLCMALDIGKSLNGANLCQSPGLSIEPGLALPPFDASKRINIDYAGADKDHYWRFTIRDNKFISKKPTY